MRFLVTSAISHFYVHSFEIEMKNGGPAIFGFEILKLFKFGKGFFVNINVLCYTKLNKHFKGQNCKSKRVFKTKQTTTKVTTQR